MRWDAVNRLIPEKRNKYVKEHNFYINQKLLISMINTLKKNIIINSNYSIIYIFIIAICNNMKIIVNRKNMIKNNLFELYNFFYKIGLVENIEL